MKVWIDLANSPHVATFEPIVSALRERGDEVVLTGRDHAQTRELAEHAFGPITLIGGASPDARVAKGWSIVARSMALRRFGKSNAPHVALSHGSYAQVLAAWSARIPSVTMMDYEHQPANHLSFRLANVVVVPEVFPDEALKRFGVAPGSVMRYPGFKEELYLGREAGANDVLSELGVDASKIIVVFRPAPEGALYHRMENDRFEQVIDLAAERDDLEVIVLPRSARQGDRYAGRPGVIVPDRPVNGRKLLVSADLMIGAGGTMNRESALLGTPTYTMFAGRLAAVDAALISAGLLFDLRNDGVDIAFEKKAPRDTATAESRAAVIIDCVLAAVDTAATRGQRGRAL